MIEILHGVYLNPRDLMFQASRSGGPGGQHVNKVSSKVILSYPVNKISGLSEYQLQKIQGKIPSYISNGVLKISSSKHRSQYSNKMDALEKLKNLLIRALKETKRRKPTNRTKASIEKRLVKKAKRSEIKKNRKRDQLTE